MSEASATWFNARDEPPSHGDASSGNDLWARVVDSIADAVFITDHYGQIVAVNASVRAMFGYEADDLIGRSVDLLVPESLRGIHGRDRAAYSATPYARNIGSDQPLTAVRANGEVFSADISLNPLPSPSGPMIIAVVRDLTERMQWEATHQAMSSSVLDGSPDAYLATDRTSLITAWNDAAERTFGWSRDEAVGTTLIELLTPQRLRVEAAQEWARFIESGVPSRAGRVSEAVACRRDGSELPIELAVTLIGEGPQASFHIFARDISCRIAAAAQQALAMTIVESSQDGIWAIDVGREVTMWNPALEQMYGVTAADVVGRPLATMLPAEAQDEMAELLESAFAGHKISYRQRRVHRDGSWFTVSGRLSPIKHDDGTVVGVCANVRDITAWERAERLAQERQRWLQSIIDNAQAAICVRDRDFRYVLANAACAQLLGTRSTADLIGRRDDQVLPADKIDSSRERDRAVLAGATTVFEETNNRGALGRTIVSQRFPLPDADGQVRAVAEIATDVTERQQVERDLGEWLEWEERIGRAVHDGRMLVYSQPIIDVATGELWGEELLVRMQGDSGPDDVIVPGQFLPQVERFGLMPVIDRFMLAEAVKLAAVGRRVSVNVSATSIEAQALADEIVAQVAAVPHAAPYLTFEITETAALAAPELARAFSGCLADLGCGLALDDFGTGYGSFTELRSLKLQTLKIDLSFVRHLATSEEDQRIVKLIIHIAREFGISTTAEGVEDADALALLREYGADRAQGYFLGRPAPVRPA